MATYDSNKLTRADKLAGALREETEELYVKKEQGKGLSQNSFTNAEKQKLAGLSNYAHPTHEAKESGLYKITVDGLGHVSGAEAASKEDITALGIAGSDTTYGEATTSEAGLMSAEDKTKLNGLSNYSHPTSAGNKHVPTGGSSGQLLGYGGSSGTAQWVDAPGTYQGEITSQEDFDALLAKGFKAGQYWLVSAQIENYSMKELTYGASPLSKRSIMAAKDLSAGQSVSSAATYFIPNSIPLRYILPEQSHSEGYGEMLVYSGGSENGSLGYWSAKPSQIIAASSYGTTLMNEESSVVSVKIPEELNYSPDDPNNFIFVRITSSANGPVGWYVNGDSIVFYRPEVNSITTQVSGVIEYRIYKITTGGAA